MFLFQNNVQDNAGNCPPSGRIHEHSTCMSIWQQAAACPTSIWMEALEHSLDAAAAASSSSMILSSAWWWPCQRPPPIGWPPPPGRITTKIKTGTLIRSASRWRWQAHIAITLSLKRGRRHTFTGNVSSLLMLHISAHQNFQLSTGRLIIRPFRISKKTT